MTFNNVLLIGTQQTHFDTVKMYRRPPLQSIRRGISTTQLVFAVLHALDGMENKLSPGLLKREKKALSIHPIYGLKSNIAIGAKNAF